MVYDYTLIENYLGTSIMHEVGLMPLLRFYTEVSINNEHQGLYYFVESSDNYCFTFDRSRFSAKILQP